MFQPPRSFSDLPLSPLSLLSYSSSSSSPLLLVPFPSLPSSLHHLLFSHLVPVCAVHCLIVYQPPALLLSSCLALSCLVFVFSLLLMVILRRVPRILSPDLLNALARMGHGERTRLAQYHPSLLLELSLPSIVYTCSTSASCVT